MNNQVTLDGQSMCVTNVHAIETCVHHFLKCTQALLAPRVPIFES